MDKFEYPRKELGYWVPADPCEPDHFEIQGATCPAPAVFGVRSICHNDGQLVLRDGENILGTFSAPVIDEHSCDQAIVFSNCGNWIWYFGYQERTPVLRLLDANNGTLLDETTPFDQCTDFFGGEPKWHELTIIIDHRFPDKILAFSNAGDTPAICAVWERNVSKIASLSSPQLIKEIHGHLDEPMGFVRIATDECVVILDDIGQFFLMDYRKGEVLHSDFLVSMLEVEDDIRHEIWDGIDLPGIDTNCFVGLLDEMLLINMKLDSFSTPPQDDWFGLAAMDRRTLKPIGLIRPPDKRNAELIQIAGNIFKCDGNYWKWIIE